LHTVGEVLDLLDLRNGNYAAARHERRELGREYRDFNRERY